MSIRALIWTYFLMTIIVDYLIFCPLLQFLRELSPKMLAIQNVQRKRKLEVTSLSEAVGMVSMLLDFIHRFYVKMHI